MGANPDNCPNCSERNTFNLDYCAVCGLRFSTKRAEPDASGTAGPRSGRKKVDPAALKAMKKKRALLTAFREGRISEEKLRKGLRDLGGSEEVERALDLKIFLEEQIRSFEKMDLSSRGEGYYPDPNASQSDLPRDDNGAVLTDFRASAEDRDYFTKGRPFEVRSKAEGDPLFKREGGFKDEGAKSGRARNPPPRMMTGATPGNTNRRTVRATGVNWDEDDDPEEEQEEGWSFDEEDAEEDDDEEFVMDLEELAPEPPKGSQKRKVKSTVEWLDDDDMGWGPAPKRRKKGFN